MNKRWKNSLSHQFMRIMGGFVLVILLVTIAIGVYAHQIETQYENKINDLREKRTYAVQLEDGLNRMFFEARGYVGFRIEDPFLNSYLDEKKELVEKINSLDATLTSSEDIRRLNDIRNYLTRFDSLFAEAKGFIETDNTEGLQSLSQKKGGTDLVNLTRDTIRNLVTSIEQEIILTEEELLDRLLTIQSLFIAFILFLLLIATLLVGTMARKIGRPLHELAIASSQVSAGESVEVPHGKRQDELGELARAFNAMVSNIQSNEKKLINTNEELITQREELKENKNELETSVKKINRQKHLLEHRNQLNRSLASTLSKPELLQSIISNMIEIVKGDRGLIVLLNQRKDYASVGLDSDKVHSWIDNIKDGPGLKAISQKKPHIVRREATLGETGYHDFETISCDIYLPILSDETVVALLCITRIGMSFSEQEEKEIQGLCRQISLALDKLRLYETTENERMVNMEILNTIREGIQLVDPSGHVVSVNDQMCTMLDACIDENVKDKRFEEWSLKFLEKVAPKDREEVRSYLENVIKAVKPKESELVYETNGEKPRFIQMYYEHLHNAEKFIGSIFVHRDITREYEVDEMKNEFVSTVSHELRTPLSSVLGFTELMISKDLKPEKQKKYLKTIHKEASRLTVLINDFLDIQRMESGKQTYNKSALNLKSIANEVLDSYHITYSKHEFVIEDLTAHHEVYGDEDKLKQLLNNLISNAVKYSPEGGQVTLRFEEDHRGMLLLSIVDEGLGIPEEALPNLFDKFYRVDNTDRRQIGGTGLGLAISKEIVNAHGGELSVASELGKGSTFSIAIPVLGKTTSTAQDGGVLIVEDDDSLALLLMEELKGNGFEVHHCRSGESAVHLLDQMTPRGIVLDIMLDGAMTGWDVLKAVKDKERTNEIPIIVSTVTEEKQRGFELGAKDYLIKPYPPMKLSSSVQKALEDPVDTGKILIPDLSMEDDS